MYDKDYYLKHRNKIVARQRNKRREKREWFNNEVLKGKSCIKCGESHIGCLDFHHRDPKEKEFGLGTIIRQNIKKDRILEEIAKCDILCSNCHRKLHWEENNEQCATGEIGSRPSD